MIETMKNFDVEISETGTTYRRKEYVYIVTANGKISSEGFIKLKDAQDFIRSRTGIKDKPFGDDEYAIIEENGVRYEIHDVQVKFK